MNILNKNVINELNERFGGICKNSNINFSYFRNDLIIKLKCCNTVDSVSKINLSVEKIDGTLMIVADYSNVDKKRIKPSIIVDIFDTIATLNRLSIVVYKGSKISEIYNPSNFTDKQDIYSCII